jgi:ankyrin repeat protein
MKCYLFLIQLLLATGLIFSCGKKSQPTHKETNQFNSEPSKGELFFRILKEMRRTISENDLESLKNLLQKNPQIDINQNFNDSGDTLLILAIKKNFQVMRDFLILQGASLEVTNINQETPLIAAVASNQIDSVRHLINLKVDLEKRDQNNDTALHVALKKSFDDIALLLLENGADLNALDSNSKAAWKLAQENNLPHSLEKIKSIFEMAAGSPDVSTFRSIILEADYKRLERILKRFPEMATNSNYQAVNPFALLVDYQDEQKALETAALLISYEMNLEGPDQTETIPLIKAVAFGEIKLASLYLSKGANASRVDQFKKSALIYAVERNDPELVKLLLSYSAERKYIAIRNGKRIIINSCKTARSVRSKIFQKNELNDNKKIIKSLDCGLWRTIF